VVCGLRCALGDYPDSIWRADDCSLLGCAEHSRSELASRAHLFLCQIFTNFWLSLFFGAVKHRKKPLNKHVMLPVAVYRGTFSEYRERPSRAMW